MTTLNKQRWKNGGLALGIITLLAPSFFTSVNKIIDGHYGRTKEDSIIIKIDKLSSMFIEEKKSQDKINSDVFAEFQTVWEKINENKIKCYTKP